MIEIIIRDKDKDGALRLLCRAIDYIEEGITSMDSHPEAGEQLPYLWIVNENR